MCDLIIIAGPNGAGKSTLAPALLRDTMGVLEYINADTIAAGLSAFAPENASFDAGRVMLTRLRELAAGRNDLAFETTLASRFYASWASELRNDGYRISIVFLWLPTPELAIERVQARVRLGGHSIPESTIRRRFHRGLKNFFQLYIPVANAWRLLDASEDVPREIARYSDVSGEMIIQKALWEQISN